MESLKIEIALATYIKNNLCLSCSRKDRESKSYNMYIRNSSERYGKFFIPACKDCWERICRKCVSH